MLRFSPVETAQAEAGRPMAHDYGETLTILVVEDDEAVADLVRTVLNQVPGWGATVVHDAAAAREVFRHVRIEVLVVDVNLPGVSGLELLELLRRDPHWDEPPVLLMSSEPDQPGILGAVRAGLVTKFLRKPFDVEALVREVHAAVAAHGSPASPLGRPGPQEGLQEQQGQQRAHGSDHDARRADPAEVPAE
jgi:DNA-binding response OmpR family regulator